MKISNILLKNIRDFQTSLERMVTGLKINKPADDPAGFFVASRFNTQIKGLENANTNIQTALTMLKVADESMGEINDILNKMRDLIQNGCNGYLTPQERELNQKQINDLFARAVEIKNGAESNGIKLFDGGSTKLDKNKTYMDGQEVVVAAGQVLTTTGKLLIDYTGTGEIIEPAAGTAWGRPEATAEPESVILNEGEESQGAAAQSVILSESEESQGEESQEAEAPVMMRMSRSMSTFAMTRSVDVEDLGTEGTREFAAGETATVKINGMTYTITNNDTENATTLYYSTNNGQIVLSGYDWEDSFTVTAADGQDDNISLRLGDYSVINTGDGNDTVDVDWACGRIWVNTGAGNDTVEINGGYDVRVDLGDGEDNLINNQGYLHFVQRSEGTDTISGSTDNVFVYDEIYEETFAARETKTITIGGKSYTVTNTDYSSSTKLEYAYNSETGQVAFRDCNYYYLNITAADGQDDDIVMYGGKALNTGDGDDVIRFLGGYGSTIDGGTGNNTYIGSTSSPTINNVQTINGVTDLGTSGEYTIAAGETKTVKINGMTYTLENTDTSDITFTYSTNADGVILLNRDTASSGSILTITAADGQADKISLGIHSATLNTGDGADTVEVTRGNSTINTGVGNDNVTVSAEGSINVNLGDGDDTLTNEGGYFVVGDGGAGADTYVDNSGQTGNTFTNFENGGNNGEITIAAGATETITVDGKSYDVKNSGSSTQTVTYSLGDDGVITFDGNSSSLNLYSHMNQEDNLIIEGSWGELHTHDLADNVTIDGTIYYSASFGVGDDTITLTESGRVDSLHSGDGQDTITILGSVGTDVYGGVGADTVTINSSASVGGTVYGGALSSDTSSSDVLYDNSTGVTNTGFESVYGTAGTIEVKSLKTVTVEIDGKKYDIRNSGGAAHTVSYSLSGGKITFNSDSDKLQLTAHEGQEDNIVLEGNWGTVDTADERDRIQVQGQVANLNTGTGNDYVDNNGSLGTVLLGDGNDQFINYDGVYDSLDGGAGADALWDNKISDSTTQNVETYTLSVAAGETITVGANGKKYDITNTSAGSQAFGYTITDDNFVVFASYSSGYHLSITAHENQADRLFVGGKFNAVNTGDGDDNVYAINGTESYTVQGAAMSASWTADIKDLNTGTGNDNITINSDGNTVNAGAGDDTITINGNNNTVSGEDGTDTLYDNGTGNVTSGFELPDTNNGTIEIAAWATETITVDGKKYDIRNEGNSTQTLTYSLNEGQITFDSSSDALHLTAHENQEDNILLTGNWDSAYTGNMDDTIVLSGSVGTAFGSESGNNNIIITETGYTYGLHGGSGNDNITVEGTVTGDIFGWDGNDTIVVENGASVGGSVLGADGDDTINVTGYVQNGIYGDAGADNITLSGVMDGLGNTIDGGADDDIIVVTSTGSAFYVYGNEGNDTITIDGNISGAIKGEGNGSNSGEDTIIVNSDGNTIYAGSNDDTITINSNNNTVYGGNDGGAVDDSTNDTAYNNGTGNTFVGVENIVGNSGTIQVKAGETVTVEIDGKKYDITNDSSTGTTSTVTYSLNEGQITFEENDSYYLTLTAHDNQEDNLVIDGFATVNTGNLNDKLTIVNAGIINTGDGDDEVTTVYKFDSYIGIINTDDGNDTITIGKDSSISELNSGDGNDNINIIGEVRDGASAGAGDDNITIAGTVSSSVDANAGNDNITINSDGNTIIGGNGDDSITINSNNNEIYGYDGDDTVTLNGKNNVAYGGNTSTDTSTNDTVYINNTDNTVAGFENIVGNSGTIQVKAGETVTVEIDGKKYDITNDSSIDTTATVTYSLKDGQITFEGNDRDYLTLTAHDNQEDNLLITGNWKSVNTGDLADTVTTNLNGTQDLVRNIDTGDGDDTIVQGSGTVGYIIAGTGNDNITIAGTVSGSVYANAGNDTITVSGTVNQDVEGGAGDDTITVTQTGKGGSICGQDGNDKLTVAGQVVDALGDAGDDVITVTETGNVKWQAYGGAGNDTITIAGFANDVRGDDGNDSITITSTGVVNIVAGDYGDDTLIIDGSNIHVGADSGQNTIYINGDNNIMSGITGLTNNGTNTINISGNNNDIEVGSGNDTISILGSNNAVSAGGGDDNINIYGDNNTTEAGSGDDLTSVVSGENNFVFGGTGYDKVANYSSKTTYAEMDELINGGSNYRVQIDGNISESSGYNMDLSMSLPPDAVFDISSVENAQNSLLQIDELIGQLTKQRGQISFQNTMLKEILDSNLTRLTNLNNSLSTVRDADTAAEYNNLLAKASLIEQGQLLQAQLLESNASVVTQLIGGIAS